MTISKEQYSALITPEHADKPKFVATVELGVSPCVDTMNVLVSMPAKYDVDVSVGVQEDADGLWIGRTRFLDVPLNAYFSFDIAGLGFDEGVWWAPGDPLDGLTRLPDDEYRVLLKAVIAANNWDGTVQGAYTAWAILFADRGVDILMQDYGNETMAICLIGKSPDAVTKALFTSGELDLKPAGYTLFHYLPTVYPAGEVGGIAGTPIFGFDAENANVAGFDVGAWCTQISAE